VIDGELVCLEPRQVCLAYKFPTLHHSGLESILRTGVTEVFVPKGLNEGS
jgi:hypothetical protein